MVAVQKPEDKLIGVTEMLILQTMLQFFAVYSTWRIYDSFSDSFYEISSHLKITSCIWFSEGTELVLYTCISYRLILGYYFCTSLDWGNKAIYRNEPKFETFGVSTSSEVQQRKQTGLCDRPIPRPGKFCRVCMHYWMWSNATITLYTYN
jgi:hypothetical protein